MVTHKQLTKVQRAQGATGTTIGGIALKRRGGKWRRQSKTPKFTQQVDLDAFSSVLLETLSWLLGPQKLDLNCQGGFRTVSQKCVCELVSFTSAANQYNICIYEVCTYESWRHFVGDVLSQCQCSPLTIHEGALCKSWVRWSAKMCRFHLQVKDRLSTA